MTITNDPKQGDSGAKTIVKSLALSPYTVATVPAVASHVGRLIYVSNGNAGTACLAYSNGTSWLRVAFGAAVATS